MTRRELLAEGAAALESAGIENAAGDALQLMLFAANADHTAFLLRRDEEAPPEEAARFGALIKKRAAREPLQYLLGSAFFLGRPYLVGEGVLIPRPETEELAELCIARALQENCRVIYDLCAGTGCVGVSVALACPGTQVCLFEKNEPALTYLRRNVPSEAAGRLHVIKADIFTFNAGGLPQPDLIVSNPPYIATGELPALQPEVRREPASALDGGADGLAFYRAIRARWMPLMNPGGFAAFECGETQTDAVCALMDGFSRVTALSDRFGQRRFVTVQV